MNESGPDVICPRCGGTAELVAPKISKTTGYCDRCGVVYLTPEWDKPCIPPPDDRPDQPQRGNYP